MKDIFSEIKERYYGFSKGQKAIADYVENHYEKAAYMTASKLGQAANVSESTVVRFATELGFDGYPRFQKELLNNVYIKLNSIERMKVTNDRVKDENMLEAVLSSDVDQIRNTLEEIDSEVFENVVDEIIKANKIYILGVRSSSALATFMGFYFNLIFDNVKVITSASTSEFYEQISRARKGDIIIGISFPRYSARTIAMLEYARNNGIISIALTDSKKSPLYENANYTLVAKSDMVSFADSLVAPLSVINALIASISRKKSADIEKNLSDLENVWKINNVYSEEI